MKKTISLHYFFIGILLLSILVSCKTQKEKIINMDNYFAWCIVPFDSMKRTPEQRIEMLKDLGFSSYAYDWRQEHLPEMVKEIKIATENNIKINAVWMWIDNNDSIGNLSQNNKKVLNSLKESGLSTQIWVGFPENYLIDLSEDERFNYAAQMVSYISTEAEKLNCKVALYNHGGWIGNPKNLVKIVESIPDHEIGIIFNFHHAHDLLNDYENLIDIMLPHLWVVNLNGMNPDGPKILPIGSGSEEAKMIQILEENGFHGPYGILGHLNADVEKVLEANIDGLRKLKSSN